MEIKPCILTADHARALDISTEGLPVNLADPVAAGRWFNFSTDAGRWFGRVGVESDVEWFARLIAAAQAGTLKLPEVKAKRHGPFGGVEFEEDTAERTAQRIGWWTALCGPLGSRWAWYGSIRNGGDIPLRPILPPPRVEVKVGDVLKVIGEPKEHPLEGSGIRKLSRKSLEVVSVLDDLVAVPSMSPNEFDWIARETIDRAVAAGTLEVQRADPR